MENLDLIKKVTNCTELTDDEKLEIIKALSSNVVFIPYEIKGYEPPTIINTPYTKPPYYPTEVWCRTSTVTK